MKFLILFALVGICFAAPQPRKIFHEHVEDFLDIIMEESGDELEHIMEHYVEFEEFWVSLEYMRTADFKNLIYEMEALPEFKAVVDFLENDNIDIIYFLDRFNEAMEDVRTRRNARHDISGRDMSAFVIDSIAVFPKDKLSALFDQKMSEEEEFRVAIENLRSDEWDNIFNALWESETFLVEAQILIDHGIDLRVILLEIEAIFGQNRK